MLSAWFIPQLWLVGMVNRACFLIQSNLHDNSNWIESRRYSTLRLHLSAVLRGLSVPFLQTTSKVSGCRLCNSPFSSYLMSMWARISALHKARSCVAFFPSRRRLINRSLSRGDIRAKYTNTNLLTFYTVRNGRCVANLTHIAAGLFEYSL